jgi:hypothetical protein
LLKEVEDETLRNFLWVFSTILSGEDVSRLEELKALLGDSENRSYFVACLQQYRLIGKFVME